MLIDNRVTRMTGTQYPIIQAPMGWIARAQLASAVSNAGGLGIIETSSGELDNIKREVQLMREMTDKPFGMNVALSYVKGTNIIDFVIEQGIKFVTTSSGSPSVCTRDFQAAGITVFHVVPTLDMALKAIDAGVDGLVLVSAGAGGHGGTLNPLSFIAEIREIFDGIIVLAGGISCGRGVAAARAAGADFAYMGTRFIATNEATAEAEYKQMLIDSRAADVIYTNSVSGVNGNFLRQSIEANNIDLTIAPDYKPGAMRQKDKKSAAWKRVWSGGHGVGTIHNVVPVADLVDQLEHEFDEAIADLLVKK